MRLTYHDIYTTSDRRIIQTILDSDDDHIKSHMTSNPNLSNDDISRLANGDVLVRKAVAGSKNIPASILTKLHEDEDAFTRGLALSNPLTDAEIFRNAVLFGKLPSVTKQRISSSTNAVRDFEVFEFMWRNFKNAPERLVNSLSTAVLFEDRSDIDPRVSDFVHEEILKGYTNDTREAYARSRHMASPEVLDLLKDDSHRPVINAIAGNPRAWPSTHDYLTSKHKSPGIRTSVARATTDNLLLNKIYHGTKSKIIREAVQNNPVFILMS